MNPKPNWRRLWCPVAWRDSRLVGDVFQLQGKPGTHGYPRCQYHTTQGEQPRACTLWCCIPKARRRANISGLGSQEVDEPVEAQALALEWGLLARNAGVVSVHSSFVSIVAEPGINF